MTHSLTKTKDQMDKSISQNSSIHETTGQRRFIKAMVQEILTNQKCKHWAITVNKDHNTHILKWLKNKF